MFSFLKRRRRDRILEHHRIPDPLWHSVIEQVQSATWMTATDHDRLRDMASLFLYEKAIEPAQGVELTDEMRARIATEAVVPVLNLGLDYYRDFHAVIVYEDAFLVRDVYQDEAGVLHTVPEERSGEAWHHGPVIVSWTDISESVPGHNVVIHEMAHKLDMLDGDANGRPPLHQGMDPAEWTSAFTAAYQGHAAGVEAGIETAIDEYAATAPAEFFAVCSEVFFEEPALLKQQWPEVYLQMSLYYRWGSGK